MGIEALSVNLDDSAQQYSPGQTIRGKVLLSISDKEFTIAVIIRFLGFALTHWREQELRPYYTSTIRGRINMLDTYDVVYQAYESLFEMTLTLFGDGSNLIKIPTGENVFPFSFQVPTRPLPANCSFENGYVQYGLEARVRKPCSEIDRKMSWLPLTILTSTDLNITPGVGQPMRLDDSREFGCCTFCFPGKPCFLRTFTPKTGFIPGEVVPVVIEVQNMSNYKLDALTATLTQVWTLFAYGRRGLHFRTNSIALQSQNYAGMGAKGDMTWEVSFTIPPNAPPTPSPAACGIVKMEYVIMISAAMESCCGINDLAVSHPIIVGTIPLVPTATGTAQIPELNENGGIA